MPIKWTPEKDQLATPVSEAWPTAAGQDKPTPRAITERLVKFRQLAKSSATNAGGDGHFSIGKGIKSSAPSTPRKIEKTALGPTPDSTKRKRVSELSLKTEKPVKNEDIDEDGMNESDEADPETFETPTKKMRGLGLGLSSTSTVRAGSTLNIKQEGGGDIFGGLQSAMRQPRARRATVPLGIVNYDNTLGDDDAEEEYGRRRDDAESSSASDYVPDGGVDPDDEYA
ncbi:hypothetical protein BJX70DRAFT_400755 [Aspergillus crustosus]